MNSRALTGSGMQDQVASKLEGELWKMVKSIEGTKTSGEDGLAQLLAAAGDDLRLRILEFVAREPKSVSQICQELEAAQPRVSHHLGILRRCGLLSVKTKGRQRVYRWAQPGGGSAAFDLQTLLRRWLGLRESTHARAEKPGGAESQQLEDFLL